MTIYLTIITTILVVTQVIRVTQNAIQLKKYGETNKDNKAVLEMWSQTSKDISEIKQSLKNKE